MSCKDKKSMQPCSCTYPCSRKGKCCECIAYHRSRLELPACYFSKEAEMTYDRSIDAFLKSINI